MGPDGPVAQLGARVNGIHEVAGSIPAWSTNFPLRPASLLSRYGREPVPLRSVLGEHPLYFLRIGGQGQG